MEVQPSHIVSDKSINMSSGISNYPKNSNNTSCPTDPNTSFSRINISNPISTNNGSMAMMPRNAPQVNRQPCSTTNINAAPNRDLSSGVTFTAPAPSCGGVGDGGGGFRKMEHTTTISTIGYQGNDTKQSNLFPPCSTSSGSSTETGDPFSVPRDLSCDNVKNPGDAASGSGINLACSETGSNLGEDDTHMDTGSVYSFRSDMDQGSSCTVNGSQCSDNTGLHPTPSMPRRTKNGILLRDRTNRYGVLFCQNVKVLM